jgi:pyruvate formate lyase activating enzyme
MIIGGLVKFSLCDYPGQPAAVIFTQGCNFRCVFCHNLDLMPPVSSSGQSIPESRILSFLEARKPQLNHVVISGGEPTIQADLGPFCKRIKQLGYQVKVDTNGSRPRVIRRLIDEGSVDYLAMDIKAPIPAYHKMIGVPFDTDAILESIAVIADGAIPHQFRTTVVDGLLGEADLTQIRRLVPAGSPHRLQPFREPTGSRRQGGRQCNGGLDGRSEGRSVKPIRL